MSKERDIWFNVSPENMENKYYSPKAGLTFELKGHWDRDKQLHYWNTKAELNAAVTEVCKTGRDKTKKIVDAFLAAGILEKQGNLYYVNRATQPFVKFDLDTVIYVMDALSDDSLKVYCYLKNKYDIHCAYDYGGKPYGFSNSELLRMMGYSDGNGRNIRKINNILNTLEELGLIEYNHNAHGRPGVHGLYKDLYRVNNSCDAKERAIVDTINDVAQEQLPQPSFKGEWNLP